MANKTDSLEEIDYTAYVAEQDKKVSKILDKKMVDYELEEDARDLGFPI